MTKGEWWLLWFSLLGYPILAFIFFSVGEPWSWMGIVFGIYSILVWIWFIWTWRTISKEARWKLDNGWDYDFDFHIWLKKEI